MKKKLIILQLMLIAFCASAQIPNGYYNTCVGSSGNALRSKLKTITKNNHTPIGYSGLWAIFYYSDVKPNGKLWDIYSYKFTGPQPYEFTIGGSGQGGQCGTYSQEGDCYNREHTWPQSYFGSVDPMVSDLNQVFPVDGTVNGVHGNDPYGNVNVANKTTLQGCKSGSSSSYPAYSGNTFEPIDSFKGDIARAYFYMATRYYGDDAGWQSWAMANGAELTQSAINVLLAWHHLDPVSQKERDRNEVVFANQGNRNPFIDSASFVDCIWGGVFCGNVAIENVIQKPLINIVANAQHLTVTVPNPTEEFTYRIINMNGQILMSQKTNEPLIDIEQLPCGLYCIQVKTNGHFQTIRFVK
jgi:endonuclease I